MMRILSGRSRLDYHEAPALAAGFLPHETLAAAARIKRAALPFLSPSLMPASPLGTRGRYAKYPCETPRAPHRSNQQDGLVLGRFRNCIIFAGLLSSTQAKNFYFFSTAQNTVHPVQSTYCTSTSSVCKG